MSYTAFKDGYNIETTFGTSTITGAGDSAYLPGIISQVARHPNPEWDVQSMATGVGAYEPTAGNMWKVYKARTGMWQVILQNGVPLWMGQGGSSTAGADPYTHTITPDALPSFTLQHERTGTGTDWAVQYVGCMVSNLSLYCSQESKGLLATVDWVSRESSDPGFTLTNSPALPATANTSPYLFSQLTRTFDYGGAGTALTGLESVKIDIMPGLFPVLAHWWDSGTDKSHVPYEYLVGSQREYTVTIEYQPESDDVYDYLESTSTPKHLYFKWTRSANDYIEIECEDAWLVSHETLTPEVDERLVEKAVFRPERLAIEVKDSIAGSAYGE